MKGIIIILLLMIGLLITIIVIQEYDKTLVSDPKSKIIPRDYQIQISDRGDYLIIWDHERFIGTVRLNMLNPLGKMIIIDND